MKTLALIAALGLAVASISSASAAPLRSGFGGAAGYGELALLPNDDRSSNALNLPFEINFFGQQYKQFFINNNGNVSFGSANEEYTPNPFPQSVQPLIAPFWADVDTSRQPGGGAVYTAAPDANTVVVTWNKVGYFDAHNDKLNDFQLTLRNRADTGAGNFDIEFRYNQLEWTTGDYSGGGGGLGGTPAQAGYDAGDGKNFFVLPGSFTNDILKLVNTSNVSLDQPGVWTMAIRNGIGADGATPEAPLLPEIVTDAGFEFEFDVDLNEQIFIDPEVAVGYEFAVSEGPNFTSVLLPTIAGDIDGYEVYGPDGQLLGIVMPGEAFHFQPFGINRFTVRDIDGGLDPSDPTAFVTGLTFYGGGTVRMTQRPITVNTDGEVPEPSSLLLLPLAGIVVAASRRKQRRVAA